MSERPWWNSVLWPICFAIVLLLSASLESENGPRSREPSQREGEARYHLRVHLAVSDAEHADQERSRATVRFFSERPVRSSQSDDAPSHSARSLGGPVEYVLREQFELPFGGEARRSMPRGVYQVVVRAPGFAREMRRVHLLGDTQLSLELAPERTLRVEVLGGEEEELVPLVGATVLAGDSDVTPIGGVTDASGVLRLAALPQGPVRVRIFAPGYESYEAVTESDLVVRLHPSSILRVRVEREGVAVPGAQVYIAGISLWPTRAVQTSDKGWVDISGLSPGTYSLYAQHESWVSTVERSAMVREESGRSEVVLTLHPGRPLRVRVVAEKDESPLPEARVSVRSLGLGQFSQHGVTNARGEVSLGPLPEPSGWLSARAAGYVAQTVELEQLPRGETTWVVKLRQAGTVRGRVVDDRGFPVMGATVEAMGIGATGEPISVTFQTESVSDAHFDWAREMGQTGILLSAGELGVLLGPVPPIPLTGIQQPRGARFSSDERGRFTINDVPPGELVVIARHPHFIDGKSPVITLQSGQQVETEIVLSSGRPLRGRVLDHREFPVQNARVTVSSRSFLRRVETDRAGFFELEAAPEQLSIRVSEPESPLQVSWAEDVAAKHRDQELKIVLPVPRQDVELRVLDPAGEPIELAQVKLTSLMRATPLSVTRFSKADGHVILPQARGLSVRLQVEAPGFAKEQRELVLAEKLRVQLERSVRVEGRVLGVRGRAPAAGARVTLSAKNVTRYAFASDEGSYILSDVPEGSATLSASHEEYGKGSRNVDVERGVAGRPAQLPDLLLEPTLRVSGIVEDEEGGPLAGALVGIERLSAYQSAGGGALVLGRTDAEGTFSIDVERQETFYVYAAVPGRAYGWSDPVGNTELDEIDDVIVVVDHEDQVPPDELASVLITLEQRGASVLVYAVASPSRAADDGLQVEDELLMVDGQKFDQVREARELLSGIGGTEVRLTVRRHGATHEIVTIREMYLR